MNDPMTTTPTFSDTVSEGIDDSTHTELDPKDDSVVLAQPTLKKPVIPLVSSAEDPLTNDASKSDAQDAPNSSTQDAQNATTQDAPNV